MARKIRKDSTLAGLLKRAGVPEDKQREVLKSPTGRTVRRDIQMDTLVKRAKREDKKQ